MIASRFAWAALLLLGANALASAQVTKKGSTYLMRCKYLKGQIIRYRSVNGIDDVTGATPSASIKSDVTLKVLDVRGGVATVQMNVGAMFAGAKMVAPPSSATFPLDNRNRGAKASGLGGQLPETAVKLGGRWVSNMSVTLFGSHELEKGSYRFAGIKTIHGLQVAVITYEIDGVAVGTGTMMVLVKDGTLFSNEIKVRLSGPYKTSRFHSIMTRYTQ